MDLMESLLYEPRILVVSNNAFSRTTNNGKTLASFFDSFSARNIAQLYFSEERPCGTAVTRFYSITDKAVLKSLVWRKYHCGGRIIPGSPTADARERRSYSVNVINNVINKIKKYEVIRIVREMLWSFQTWNTKLLHEWLTEFSPEMIFFCAGDSGFAYSVVESIQKEYGCRLAVYITDDYVLPRRTMSPIWWLRRTYLLKKMKSAVERSDLFFTISPKMREVYRALFGKDSVVIMNMAESLRDCRRAPDSGTTTLTYAGGLHYKRYETLRLLAESLKEYNAQCGKNKAVLKIYCAQNLNKKIVDYITIDGASQFCGGLDEDELKIALNRSDILVHVESFDRRCIESTRLSISTKIPEYLSVGKPILAIGPEEVASVEYLEDAALCVTDPADISSELARLLSDSNLRARLSERALAKYESHHRKEIVARKFKAAIREAVAST